MNVLREFNRSKGVRPVSFDLPTKLADLLMVISQEDDMTHRYKWVTNELLMSMQEWVENHEEEVEDFEMWWEWDEEKRKSQGLENDEDAGIDY